MTCNIF